MAKFKGFGKVPKGKNSTDRDISKAFAIALEHYQAGRLVQAEQICRQILQQQPSHLEVLQWLASIAYQTGRLEETASYCQKALALNPNNLELLCNLGSVLQELGNLEEATLNFQKAVAQNPNYAVAHHGLGAALIQGGQLDQAVTHLLRAIALNPNDAKAYCSLGVALQEQGLPQEALSMYQNAIQIQPDIAEAHLNLGQILLLNGDFSRGFAELEWRWQSKDWADPRSLSQPLWDGSNLESKTILLHAEQGFGDTILFIRYAPLVAARGGRVVVECPASLKRLLATVPSIEHLVVRGEPLPHFHVHSPLMSLPRILGTTLETIPACIPYLSPPTDCGLKLEALPDTKLKVGIVWACGYRKPHLLRDHQHRSCPLSTFARLFSIPGISFYSLQVGENAADIAQLGEERKLQDLSPHIQDFADTAASIAQMDLVISVDTAVAHLAGALAKPVWVLLPSPHDWRWFLEREDSPWYPTMRLFHQSRSGDWEGVLEQVAQALILYSESSEQSTVSAVEIQSFPVVAPVSLPDADASAISQALTIASEHYRAGHLLQAEQVYRQILQQQPEQREVLNQLGLIAYQTGRLEETADYFQKALALNPNNLELLCNLGSVLQELGKLEEAIPNFQKALALSPNYALAHLGLGVTFMQQRKFEQAVTHLQRAIALNPNDAKAYCSLGLALWEQGLIQEAFFNYQKSLQIQPNIPETHFNLSQILLLRGDFCNGFAEYEWRWQLKDWRVPRSFSQPLWDGSNLEGKTIFLYAEQGIGDTIQFIRYAPLVAARGGRVVVGCQTSLKRLLTTVSGIDRLVVGGETLPEFQVHLPLMSLPRILGTTLETIPAQIPYLFPPASHSLKLEIRPGTRLKVGIVWASRFEPNSLRDYQRKSCPLSSFARLFSIPGISFYSLQVGKNAADIAQLGEERKLQDLSPHIQDFADTAASIAQMDLVISVDTAVAHLAGALAKPVWVLLSSPHDWRWLLEREDSPWYPTMRLFRQSRSGDWEGVLEQVAQALRMYSELSEQSTVSAVEIQNFPVVAPVSLPDAEVSSPMAQLAKHSDRQSNNLQLPMASLQGVARELEAGQEVQTEQEYRQILQQSQFEGLHHLGVIAYQLGNLEEATAYFQKATALNPQDLQAQSNLSVVLLEQGKWAEAIIHLQQVIVINPKNDMAHTNLGNVLREQGDLKAAILHFQTALALNPNNAFAYNGLGIALGNQGQWEEATSHFHQAVSLNSEYADAHNNLGLVLQELGKLEAAAVHYQKAIALQPENSIAYTNLGNLLHEQGQLEEAIFNFQKALALNPKDDEARNSLVSVLQEAGFST